ncbi:MAG: SDR family NAD(P)-dependent oxidoreductase, partial [Thermoplasmata archaeon]|nr:SDR family NAD(P)-dependent oxidoreductase [Thermoplasmata archaeon]
CVVTGATSGIGWETARALGRRGGIVVVLGRHPARTAAAALALSHEFPSAKFLPVAGDLSDQVELRRVAAEVRAVAPAIDVLVNNAGAIFSRFETTTEGIERTWALNVLAPFLLTTLLLEPLRGAAPSRVVMVSSAAHRGVHLRLDTHDTPRRYSGYGTYGRSKLALLLLTREFARRLDPQEVCVNAAHPGFVATRFGTNNPGFYGLGFGVLSRVFGVSASAGARTPVYLASAPELIGVSGGYFVRQRPSPGSQASRELDTAAHLWTRCLEQTGERTPLARR